MSCLQALDHLKIDHPIIKDIISKLTSLKASGFDIHLCWLPVHVGIRGNEHANRAAKTDMQPCLIPPLDFKPIIRKHITAMWQNTWDESPLNKLHEIAPIDNEPYTHHLSTCRDPSVFNESKVSNQTFSSDSRVFSPQERGLIIWPPSVRPSVDSDFSGVWVNWFETLGQEQVRSEDYARQIDFWYHSKWRPGGHLGCKQTWSRNSNNTNWISFKLGAERTLGMANMYAHLFSVRFKKWRHGGHFCFFTPTITLFWLISRKLCKIGD